MLPNQSYFYLNSLSNMHITIYTIDQHGCTRKLSSAGFKTLDEVMEWAEEQNATLDLNRKYAVSSIAYDGEEKSGVITFDVSKWPGWSHLAK